MFYSLAEMNFWFSATCYCFMERMHLSNQNFRILLNIFYDSTRPLSPVAIAQIIRDTVNGVNVIGEKNLPLQMTMQNKFGENKDEIQNRKSFRHFLQHLK